MGVAIVEVVLLGGSSGAAFVRDTESLHSVGSSEHIINDQLCSQWFLEELILYWLEKPSVARLLS